MNTYKLLQLTLLSFSLAQSAWANEATAPQMKKACDSAEHRQFDFWLGDWQVKDKDGKLQGNNQVLAILDGCVVAENWQSAQGDFVGKSYNFYDPQLKQWHQTWADNQGGILFLDGKLEGGIMILHGSRPGKNDTTSLHQIIYTPLSDGRVEQKWLSSSDDGLNWQQVFLGYYQK